MKSEIKKSCSNCVNYYGDAAVSSCNAYKEPFDSWEWNGKEAETIITTTNTKTNAKYIQLSKNEIVNTLVCHKLYNCMLNIDLDKDDKIVGIEIIEGDSTMKQTAKQKNYLPQIFQIPSLNKAWNKFESGFIDFMKKYNINHLVWVDLYCQWLRLLFCDGLREDLPDSKINDGYILVGKDWKQSFLLNTKIDSFLSVGDTEEVDDSLRCHFAHRCIGQDLISIESQCEAIDECYYDIFKDDVPAVSMVYDIHFDNKNDKISKCNILLGESNNELWDVNVPEQTKLTAEQEKELNSLYHNTIGTLKAKGVEYE